MAYYAVCLKYNQVANADQESSEEWAKKALSSGNMFAIGYCHLFGLGTEEDMEKAFPFLEASAKQGTKI